MSVKPPEPNARGDPLIRGDPLNKGDPLTRQTPSEKLKAFIERTDVAHLLEEWVDRTPNTAALIIDENYIIVYFKSNLFTDNYQGELLESKLFIDKNIYEFFKNEKDVKKSKKLLEETKNKGNGTSMPIDVKNLPGVKRLQVRAFTAPKFLGDKYLSVFISLQERLEEYD